MSSAASRNLEIFDNPNPKRDYLIHMEIPEFTCLCPLTGQPDFATLVLDYIPDEKNLELKALKLYMWSFRNEGHFHEDITNRILDDFVEAVHPRFMRLEARWWVRGGIYTTVRAEYRKAGLGAAAHGRSAAVPDERSDAHDRLSESIRTQLP